MCHYIFGCCNEFQTNVTMIVVYRPAARRWAQSYSWCSPRWSCQSRPSWHHTSCRGTRTPWRRWRSAWWPPPTRCWSAWRGRSWFGQCWSPGIEPAAGRESRWRGTHPPRCAWGGEGGRETERRTFELGGERRGAGLHTTVRPSLTWHQPCEQICRVWCPILRWTQSQYHHQTSTAHFKTRATITRCSDQTEKDASSCCFLTENECRFVYMGIITRREGGGSESLGWHAGNSIIIIRTPWEHK